MDKVYLGNKLESFEAGEAFLPVSRVILKVDGENEYIAGDESGRTIEKTCAWASQEMADNVLENLKGFSYNPFDGGNALLDPAVELGDAITVSGKYGILAGMSRKLDRQYPAGISAPGADELEDEFPYTPKERREIERVLSKTYSRISKTANQIRLEVSNDIAGLSSSFTVKLDSITSRVQDAEGNISTLEQTVSGFDARVDDVESGLSQTVSMTAAGILISNEDGSELEIDGGQLKAETVTAYRLQADTIRMKTADGTTVANFYLDHADTADYKLELQADALAIMATTGNLHLGQSEGVCFLQVRPGAVVVAGTFRPNADDSVYLGTSSKRWAEIYCVNDVIQTSDRRRKKNISYGLSRYDSFFDRLKPGAYQMENGKRTHTGLVAQDVETILEECGIDTMDFAGFVKSEREDGSGYDYGLRYSEFIPLLIEQIQGLKQRVKELEKNGRQKTA